MTTSQNSSDTICQNCGKICKTVGGLKLHLKANKCGPSQQKRNAASTQQQVFPNNEGETNSPSSEPETFPVCQPTDPTPPAPPPSTPPDPDPDRDPPELIAFEWGDQSSESINNLIASAYEKVVFWRKNLFLLPTSQAGKEYIDETSRLLNAWAHDSPLDTLAFKAIMIMPNLLLQKPFKSSKTRDHVKTLERRLNSWKNGNLDDLVAECQTIQDNLPSFSNPKTIGEISKKFAKRMMKGNVNGALKLLTENMQDGLLPLNDQTLELLRAKHPEPRAAFEEIMLPDEPRHIHPILFESITSETIMKAAIKTKGGSGPSNMDADGWRRILLSKSFGDSSSNLCQAIANVTKKLCTRECRNIDALLASRLIPLNKNPGLRPIGVGEILRRIIGKAVVAVTRDHIAKSVTSLQVCAGQEGGCEAAVHAMRSIFDDDETEAVLMIDASNAFNAVNRQVFLHNVKVVCPEIATFVTNCYSSPARLFVIGGFELLSQEGFELLSQEGTTQGDPIAMAVYAVATIPLLLMVINATSESYEKQTKAEAYADDFSAAGKINGIKCWWNNLCRLGPMFGYYPEAKKCWLIVKPSHLQKAEEKFCDSDINITTEGKRHLGASLGSNSFRDEYVSKKIDTLCAELLVLSEIARIEPHCAYACFVSGFKNKHEDDTWYLAAHDSTRQHHRYEIHPSDHWWNCCQ